MSFAKTLGAAAVLVAAGTGLAKERDEVKDTPKTVLLDAEALASKKQPMKAAERYGDALALAHSAGDLQAEALIADSLEDFFREFGGNATARQATPSVEPSGCAILAAVMRRLDAGRCGAFVSAPVLARNVLFLATETGDLASVPDAAKVAAAHAARPTSGAASAAVARYAAGLQAVAARTPEQATAPLAFAAAVACKEAWFELATHATTELAAAWVTLQDADKAADAVATTVEELQGRVGPNAVAKWLQDLRVRLPGGPKGVSKPVEDFLDRIEVGGRQVHGDGGAPGAAGRSAGARPVSDIGKLLPTFPEGGAFVSAKRTALGFEVRFATKSAAKPQFSEFNESQVVHQASGGVVVTFFGRSASLQAVDLVGNVGDRGGGDFISPVRACYLIAEGETWKAAKDGVVTITR